MQDVYPFYDLTIKVIIIITCFGLRGGDYEASKAGGVPVSVDNKINKYISFQKL